MISVEKMNFEMPIIITTLNALWVVSQAVPLVDLNNALEQTVLQDIVTSACSSSGKCWKWLPAETHENIPLLKSQVRRQTSKLDSNALMESWDDNEFLEEKKVRPSSHTMRQIGNRLSKKDVFMSRGLSVGGMPFSVLYMSPHGSRGSHTSTTQQQEIGKPSETSTTSLTHPNYRIAIRNGPFAQPRRQYSIIPQLFISYGWGPFGK